MKEMMRKEFPIQPYQDGSWVYEDEETEIVKVESFLKKYLDGIEFYKVRLVNYLGWHENKSDCLVLIDRSRSKVLLVEPLWYGGIEETFITMFIGKAFEDKTEFQNFAFSLQDILLVGSEHSKDFRNTNIEGNKITFDLYETYGGERIWRKIELGIKDGMFRYLISINPSTKRKRVID